MHKGTLNKLKNISAQKRFEIIFPLLNAKRKMFNEVSIKENVSVTTLYRWVKLYKTTGLVESLLGKPTGGGGKGESRLTEEQDKIISETIKLYYLNNTTDSANKTIQIIFEKCIKENINPPNPVTIKKRIKKISGKEILISNAFSTKEDDFIKKNYLNISINELARILNRSSKGVDYRMKKLGLIIPEEILNIRFAEARFKKGTVSNKKLKDFEETIKISKGGKP